MDLEHIDLVDSVEVISVRVQDEFGVWREVMAVRKEGGVTEELVRGVLEGVGEALGKTYRDGYEDGYQDGREVGEAMREREIGAT